jgi:hypothetical protein
VNHEIGIVLKVHSHPHPNDKSPGTYSAGFVYSVFDLALSKGKTIKLSHRVPEKTITSVPDVKVQINVFPVTVPDRVSPD